MSPLPHSPDSATSRVLYEAIEAGLSADRAKGRRTAIVVVEFASPPVTAVLRELALRLSSLAREDDVIGQLSPIRLVLLVRSLREVDALAQIIVRITAELARPIEVLGQLHECSTTVSGAISDARSTAWTLIAAALDSAGSGVDRESA